MSIPHASQEGLALRRHWRLRLAITFACLLTTAAAATAAERERIAVFAEADMFSEVADDLGSAFDASPLPEQGAVRQPVLLDGHHAAALAGVMPRLVAAVAAGVPVVILEPAAETQSLLDDLTDGEVDLPEGLSAAPALGEARLAAIGVRRRTGAPTAEIGEFWVVFDGRDGSPEDEKAEDEMLVGSIADWLAEEAPAPPRRASAAAAAAPRLAKAGDGPSRPSIDDLTTAVVRKVSFQFDQGSMATVIRSWAAYSPAQDEDWYIFELTTTSQPLNFTTYSVNGLFADWEKNDTYCRGILKTGCKRDRYATVVQVRIEPKTPGLELVYYGPDSDRAQDEYSYSSKFSLGGKITAGYDDKGPKGGVELSGGAEFSRSGKVTIKDATLVGISNPATEVAGWRFDMPQMRAVNDLTPYGGPSMSCDNLLQMPYPVQRGSMESKQYAIYRLPASRRGGLQGIDIAVSLRLEESASWMQNWTAKFCNFFNCNCSPESYVVGNRQVDGRLISFPLAAHKAN